MLTHQSVLLEEAVDGLALKEGGTYVDATLGGGGHAEKIAERIGPNGTLIAIDQDDYALERAKARLEPLPCQIKFVKNNFSNLEQILQNQGIDQIDGILYDLGVSSFQLDDESRGFSYHHEGKLDMRMDKTQDLTAYDIINSYDFERLRAILKDYGEERYAGKIANAIIRSRETKPIETTTELAEIVKKAYPPNKRYRGKHPARKTFQALRIEVNRELSILEPSFEQAIKFLKPGGRIAVISFHSLEDRIVKHFFKQKQDPCTCPPDFPVCVCGHKPELKIITRKPITPTEEELEENHRTRSSKLRIAEKLEG